MTGRDCRAPMSKSLIAAAVVLAGLLAGCSTPPTRPAPSAFLPSNVNSVTGERTQY